MSLSSWSSWCLWPYIVYNIICLNCFISYDENLKSDEVFSFPREIVVVPLLTLVVDDGHFLLFRLLLDVGIMGKQFARPIEFRDLVVEFIVKGKDTEM